MGAGCSKSTTTNEGVVAETARGSDGTQQPHSTAPSGKPAAPSRSVMHTLLDEVMDEQGSSQLSLTMVKLQRKVHKHQQQEQINNPNGDDSDTDKGNPTGDSPTKTMFHQGLTTTTKVSRAREILFDDVVNENDGFLSPQNGFLPTTAPLQRFTTDDPALIEWDQLVEETRGTLLMQPSKFRSRVDALPAFPVDRVQNTELLRASSVLGTILQIYWYCGADRQVPRQDILLAWGGIRQRLNWHVEDEDHDKHNNLPFYTLFDYCTYNWRQQGISGTYDVQDLQLDKLELNTLGMAPVDHSERLFYTVMVIIMARGAQLPILCVEAQEAAARRDDSSLAVALMTIRQTWEHITDALSQLNPHHGAGMKSVDAIVFSRLFADLAIPMPITRTTPQGKKIISPSTGQSVPLFQLMDCFFNRRVFTGIHGEDVARHIKAYPKRWGNFIDAIQNPDNVSATHIDTYICQSGNTELHGLFSSALQSYAGENGFMGRHLVKMFGYMTMLFRTGRQATMGGYSGHPLDRIEDRICTALTASMRDRFAERPGTLLRQTARLNQTAVPLGPGDSPMWSVCLDVQGEGMICALGDHLRIWPKNMVDVGDQFCELISRTLDLTPDSQVDVADAAAWKEQLRYFMGEEAPTTLRVADIALYGQIAKYVTEDQAITVELLQSIMPVTARTYSISVVQNDKAGHATFLYLTVREWKDGVASRLLVRGQPGTEIAVQVYQSHVLRRVSDGPTIYFASGTGLSPFTNFYSDNSFPHRQWLIWATRNLSDDMQSDFKFVARYNRHLDIDVLQTETKRRSSRAKKRSIAAVQRLSESQSPQFTENFVTHDVDAPRGNRLAAFFSEGSPEREQLREWISEKTATVLACGNIGFVMEVVNLLRDSDVDIAEWVATGRLRVECFGAPGWVIPSGNKKIFSPWDVLRSALPNNENTRDVPLMVLGSNVYEVTENMLDIHPGGRDLLEMYQGADATRPFSAVGHNKDGSATGMLQAFEVGRFDPAVLADPCANLDIDLTRLAWDCAEMRNCHLIDDSLHERMQKKPDYCELGQEIHESCALATHHRAVGVHFPRICDSLKTICDALCPSVEWEVLLEERASQGKLKLPSVFGGKTEAGTNVHDTRTPLADVSWQDVRTTDRNFFTACVAHMADLCEEVASDANNLEPILVSWIVEVAKFEAVVLPT